MEESFKIEVPYKNEVCALDTRIIWTGYQHKIEVIIDAISVLFEPDEERNYRAVVGADISRDTLNPEKIKAVAVYLDAIMND